MSKWILMPDSFKGTMSSLEICQLMREALLRHVPDAEVVSIPVADGGEGSVEAFLAAMGGHRVEVPCTGPDFRKISGFYGLLADGYTAVIEMAAAAGLPLMEGRLCAEGATTYGVGELILAAIRDGARRIILGLGGSATNDGGCGCAAALGIRFLDQEGNTYVPTGGTLDRLARIDASGLDPAVRADLFNPMRPVKTKDMSNPSTYYGPLSKSKSSLVADGCIIEGEVENSILFRGVRVEKGAKVQNCILMQGTVIQQGATLKYAITDKNVQVNAGRMLMGHETYPLAIAKNAVV